MRDEARRPRRTLRRGGRPGHGPVGCRGQGRRPAAASLPGATPGAGGRLSAARTGLRRRRLPLSARRPGTPGRGTAALRRSRLHPRQDQDRRGRAGPGPAPYRQGAAGSRRRFAAGGRRDEPLRRGGAVDAAKALAPLGLWWFEDICDPHDFPTQAEVADIYPGPIGAGEALFSLAEARLLDLYGGLRRERDVLVFDPVHCYGLPGYLAILDHLCARVGRARPSARTPATCSACTWWRPCAWAGPRLRRRLSGHSTISPVPCRFPRDWRGCHNRLVSASSARRHLPGCSTSFWRPRER